MKRLKPLGAATALLVATLVCVLCTPQPLFAHQMTYGRYDLRSDRPIDPAGARVVLDDAERRIARSALFSSEQRFAVFICNDNWKLALYSLRFSGGMGGAADVFLTRNIYLRQADLSTNRLIPAHGWKATMVDRPLAYYIAHEATHSMESRAFGRLMSLRYPAWIREGYADYVGKDGRFDVAANLAALEAGDPAMDPKRSGLYRRYHLAVAYELDHRGKTVHQLFAEGRGEASVLKALQSDPTFGK